MVGGALWHVRFYDGVWKDLTQSCAQSWALMSAYGVITTLWRHYFPTKRQLLSDADVQLKRLDFSLTPLWKPNYTYTATLVCVKTGN